MNPVNTPQFLKEYYGGNNLMVLALDSGNYEVRVTVQDEEVVVTRFQRQIYEDAARFKAFQDLIISRINRKIAKATGQ